MQFQFSVILLPSYMYPGLDNSAAWRLGPGDVAVAAFGDAWLRMAL
jgi:hypothetical protein